MLWRTSSPRFQRARSAILTAPRLTLSTTGRRTLKPIQTRSQPRACLQLEARPRANAKTEVHGQAECGPFAGCRRTKKWPGPRAATSRGVASSPGPFLNLRYSFFPRPASSKETTPPSHNPQSANPASRRTRRQQKRTKRPAPKTLSQITNSAPWHGRTLGLARRARASGRSKAHTCTPFLPTPTRREFRARPLQVGPATLRPKSPDSPCAQSAHAPKTHASQQLAPT